MGRALGLAGSLVLHAGLAAYVGLYMAPDLGFEFVLPEEVEFGIVEGGGLSLPLTEGGPEDPASPAGAPAAAMGGASGAADGGMNDSGAGSDGGAADSAVDDPDAGPRRRRRRDAGNRDAGAKDAGAPLVAEPEDSEADDAADPGFDGADHPPMPPGAQLALRLNMELIRQSSLAPEVRRLLSAIPDWQQLLADSGIDPLVDLDRLLIASPNLRPDRMVLGGRHNKDRAFVRQVVAAMATHRRVPAAFEQRGAVEVAPWPDASGVERVVALLSGHHFTITRPDDLPRVLAVAQARAAEGEAEGPEALLSMPEGDAATAEVENVTLFAPGAPAEILPQRLLIGIRERPEGGASIRAVGIFESAEQAATAQAFWDRQRRRYAGDFLVGALGLDGPLRGADLAVDHDRLVVRTGLNRSQLAFLLAHLERQLSTRQRILLPATAPTKHTPPVSP